MRLRIGWVIPFSGLLCACSLIVGGKLDEKAGDARPGTTEGRVIDLGATGLAVKGESPSSPGFFVIGDRLEITSANPKWSTANNAKLIDGDASSPCPGGLAGQVFRCTIPSLTPEGTLTLRVTGGDDGSLLGEAKIQIRRLVGVGGSERQEIILFTAEPFERIDPPIALPGKLAKEGTTPLLSPSGRYLLLQLEAGLVLIDLVTRRSVPVPLDPLKAQGTSPHSFEPELLAVPRTTSPLVPIIFHLPEERIWLVSASGELLSFEIQQLLDEKNPAAKKYGTNSLRQVLWAVAPDLADTKVGRKVGAAIAATPAASGKQTHYLIRPGGNLVKVGLVIDGTAASAACALPIESASNLRRELYFIVQVNLGPKSFLTGFNESGAPLENLPLTYKLLGVEQNLVPSSLSIIPSTGLIGFNFSSYPNTGVADEFLYAALAYAGNKSVLAQKSDLLSGYLSRNEVTEVLPTTYAKWRFLIRSGSKLSVYPGSIAYPTTYQKLLPGLLNATHHPRLERIFALFPNELRRIDYSTNPEASVPWPNLPTLANGGVLIQP